MSGNALASFALRLASLNIGGGATLESLPEGVCAVATVGPSPSPLHTTNAKDHHRRVTKHRPLNPYARCEITEEGTNSMADIDVGNGRARKTRMI